MVTSALVTALFLLAPTGDRDVPSSERFRIVPMSDDPVRTMITVVDEGEIGFQDYFVRRRHDVGIEALVEE